jgi:hypothetical protein
MAIVWASIFVLAVLLFGLLNLLGLSGNWLIVAASALYSWLATDVRMSVGWPTVGLYCGVRDMSRARTSVRLLPRIIEIHVATD